MSQTPPLPDWIRNARVPGYVTAHELCPDATRLFGTESLYGDWGGQVLLLAKDFAPSSFLREQIAAGEAEPYSHDPERRTNKRLRRFSQPYEQRGLLYGSALANLLRDDGKWSGALPNRGEALGYGMEVLRFVLDHMPRMRRIVCLGDEAWTCATRALGLVGGWCFYRDAGGTLGPLIAGFHPAARISNDAFARPWRALELS